MNRSDPDVERRQQSMDKLYACQACNKSIQKKRLPQAHATIALVKFYLRMVPM